MSIHKLLLTFGCALALLGGCADDPEPEPEPEPTAGAEEPEPEPEPMLNEQAAEWTPPEDVAIEGDRITIDGHINFETDSDVILADSSELLDHIADVVVHHPEIHHLKIVGHTDAAGGPEHNQELSEQRAAAVVAALQERGVEIDLRASGVGETEPLCEEDTDECHAQNRRVEFLIISDEDWAAMEEG